MVICLERGADLHMAQLMPLPLTVSCFSKIQIGFTFLVPAHPGSPGQRAVKRVCVCVCLCDKVPVSTFVDHCASLYLLTYCLMSRCSAAARREVSPQSRGGVYCMIVMITMLVTSLALRTLRRNADWLNEEALYRSGIGVNPAKGQSRVMYPVA